MSMNGVKRDEDHIFTFHVLAFQVFDIAAGRVRAPSERFISALESRENGG